jgi:thioredoxin 1
MSVLDVGADSWDDEVLKSESLVVVDFWHERCTWCKRLEPIYEELSGVYEGSVKFTKLNVLENDENRHLGLHNGVMGTPTLIFFCAGRSVGSFTGFQPKDRLKKIVDEMIEKNESCVEQSTELAE